MTIENIKTLVKSNIYEKLYVRVTSIDFRKQSRTISSKRPEKGLLEKFATSVGTTLVYSVKRAFIACNLY